MIKYLICFLCLVPSIYAKMDLMSFADQLDKAEIKISKAKNTKAIANELKNLKQYISDMKTAQTGKESQNKSFLIDSFAFIDVNKAKAGSCGKMKSDLYVHFSPHTRSIAQASTLLVPALRILEAVCSKYSNP